MRAICPLVRPAVAFAAVLFAVTAVAPAVAVSPSPPSEPSVPGWLDKAVRSRDLACAVSIVRDEVTSERERVAERIVCSVAMTDAMAGGDLSADVTVTFAPPASMAGTWDGRFAISGDGGSWEGSGHGAAVREAAAGRPALYGEVHYVGSGDCAGLDYTQLVAGSAVGPSALSGWLEGPLGPSPYLRLVQTPKSGV